MSSTSGDVMVTLVSADPGAPAKGTNEWTVSVSSASGAPLSGATLAIEPFMPDHGHGTSVVPQLTSTGAGTWSVSQLYLFMPGVWRVTFSVTQPAKTTDVAFFFCIAG